MTTNAPNIPAPTPIVGPRLDWYRDVVIYQVHVRSFFDSNGDGIGDFPGLTEKLEYIASLGVTAVWLLPFYPSPLRDEGYDIADYWSVNPAYGTLDDFRHFLDAAHRAGLKVITEMVVNHTSDQHPWFQRARRAPKGSPERDFYVWSDTADRYPEVRVIFKDFEASNWAWDHIAQQYYWHRFYSHQPDLNFDNPAVQQAVLDVCDFWFGMGVDGVRLDAIPYLFERDGTNCESLPETHAFLKRLRAHIDERFPGSMLLAEANQWPDETAAYFGDDDECQMCFNFPLMPRLFMAVQQEERFPIVDILRHTPLPPPRTSQWAIFLRNHDELTLEMVTEEERDAMYRFYATDPQSRINLGLRRRLAPLLRNDRRKLELMHAMLFSLPGTPVMYYGDEICMGDNIYLRDRDSVRTPMQWSPDRNAGFSRGNTQRLFLPTIVDPEYHYESCNVETEEQSPHSFLWWLRRVLRLRAQTTAFSRGELEFLFPHNPRILAFVRRHEDEVVLVLMNLSRLSQYVELDLAAYRGRTPIELFGRTRFPMIGELPYLLTLGPHGFYWFRLDWPAGEEHRQAAGDLPVVSVSSEWIEAFRRPALEQTCDALATYLTRQAWHQSPERTLRTVELIDVVTSTTSEEDGTLYAVVLVRAHYTEGESAIYQMTFAVVGEQRAQAIIRDRPTAGALRVASARGDKTWYICDGTAERGFWERVTEAGTSAASALRTAARIERRVLGSSPATASPAASATSSLMRTSGTRGTVVSFDDRLFLKLFRRVEPGIHPEIEAAATLAKCSDSLPVAKLRGTWEYRRPDGVMTTLGAIFDFIPHERSLLDWSREELRRALETASTYKSGADAGTATVAATPEGAGDVQSPNFTTAQRTYGLIGRKVAELHAALVDIDEDPNFAPEVFTKHYRRSLHFAFRSEAQRTFEMVRDWIREVGGDREANPAVELMSQMTRVERGFAPLLNLPVLLWRIRCHGTLGLAEILLQGDDVQVVDWGGNPARPFTERRIKRCALDDVARLSLSLQTTVAEATEQMLQQVQMTEEAAAKVRATAREWRELCGREFLQAYRRGVADKLLVPESDEEFAALFDAYRLDAAIELLLQAVQRRHTDEVLKVATACLEILPANAS